MRVSGAPQRIGGCHRGATGRLSAHGVGSHARAERGIEREVPTSARGLVRARGLARFRQRTHKATPRVATATVEALLAGPTPAERVSGVSTAIPAGTQLLGISIDGGVATVDLTSEYQSGGSSHSMQVRLGQVVCTLTQFPTVRSVRFRLDGAPVNVLSSEGIVLDHPSAGTTRTCCP